MHDSSNAKVRIYYSSRKLLNLLMFLQGGKCLHAAKIDELADTSRASKTG